MKCPIVREDVEVKGKIIGTAQAECAKEECAWWSIGEGECAIHEIPATLFVVARLLEDILEKME